MQKERNIIALHLFVKGIRDKKIRGSQTRFCIWVSENKLKNELV